MSDFHAFARLVIENATTQNRVIAAFFASFVALFAASLFQFRFLNGQFMSKHAGLIFFGIPMLMYVLQGAMVYYAEHRYGMTLCVCAYSLANVGLILDLYGI